MFLRHDDKWVSCDVAGSGRSPQTRVVDANTFAPTSLSFLVLPSRFRYVRTAPVKGFRLDVVSLTLRLDFRQFGCVEVGPSSLPHSGGFLADDPTKDRRSAEPACPREENRP